jgi:hypothetical protein
MNTARFLAILLLAAVVGLVGYQIGVSQNIAVQIPAGAAPVAYYGYPWHFGFGFLGFLFPLFFLFLIFGLMRAAFGGGRGWGRGYGHGSWADERRARFEEMHRELHGEKPSTGGPSSTST